MNLVIVESPYAGNISSNIEYAQKAIKDCLIRNEAPFASHLLYTQPNILNDTIPQERNLGIQAGFWWGKAAHYRIVYVDYGISVGMIQGIQEAENNNQKVLYRSIEACFQKSFYQQYLENEILQKDTKTWINRYLEAAKTTNISLQNFMGITLDSHLLENPERLASYLEKSG